MTTTVRPMWWNSRTGNSAASRSRPEEAGLSWTPPEALKGGEPSQNAQALRDVVAGKPGAYRDISRSSMRRVRCWLPERPAL